MSCLLCNNEKTEYHHVFYGSGLREKSAEWGAVIPLCPHHHRSSPQGVLHNRQLDLYFKQLFQRSIEAEISREEFIKTFGRSWL